MISGGSASLFFYLGLSCIIGIIGKNTKFGFWGNFLVSVILSPLVGLIVMLAQDQKIKQD